MKLAVLSLAVATLLAPLTVSTAEAAPRDSRAQFARSRGGAPTAAYARRYDGRRFDGRRFDGRHRGPWARGYYGRYRHSYPYYVGFYPGFYPYGYAPYYYGAGVSIGYPAPVYDEAPYPYFRRAARVYEGKIVAETAPGRIGTR
ncbi:MAG: hypothetical protein JSR82_24265 [Verrucomicrobia bacterium]|nr:hypothetical protein [Verrucomicrobiota bacterium]